MFTKNLKKQNFMLRDAHCKERANIATTLMTTCGNNNIRIMY